MTTVALTVLDAFDAVIQDLGRTGVDVLGIPRGGASDAFSLRAANALVGNAENAPVVEITGAGLDFISEGTIVVAVTGSRCTVTVDGETIGHTWSPLRLQAGTRIAISSPLTGYRTYVAFRGTIAADNALGSVAPLMGEGFENRLSSGFRLIVETPHEPSSQIVAIPAGIRDRAAATVCADRPVLDVLPGLDERMFGGLERLYDEDFVTNPRSNAVGTRLNGLTPVRDDHAEILSRSIPYGSIEIPSEGEVIVLMRSRFVTAGYPVPGVVSTASLDVVGQLAPGTSVRFRRVTEQQARAALFQREVVLDELRRLAEGEAA